MGSPTLVRPVSQGIQQEIEALFGAAKRSGNTIIDVSGEAERLRQATPDSGMTALDIAEAITKESIRHSGIGIILPTLKS